jgi:hypothetical protein
MKSEMYMYMY